MKITHNKIGRNLNVVDGGKSEKADKATALKGKGNLVASEEESLKSEESNRSDSVKVDLSPRAMEAKRIKELAMSAPDVDTEKVAKLQKLIDEGKYKIDAKAIADKMVDEHLNSVE